MVASRLFCADTVLIDVVLTVASLPQRAGDVRATSQLITTGGGFNAMSAAARHDVAVVYAGRLGSGPFATLASADLAREGIGVPVEANREVDCGICVVLVEPDAERTFITTTGAESTVRASDLAALDVKAGDYVLVSGYNVMYETWPGSYWVGWSRWIVTSRWPSIPQRGWRTYLRSTLRAFCVGPTGCCAISLKRTRSAGRTMRWPRPLNSRGAASLSARSCDAVPRGASSPNTMLPP